MKPGDKVQTCGIRCIGSDLETNKLLDSTGKEYFQCADGCGPECEVIYIIQAVRTIAKYSMIDLCPPVYIKTMGTINHSYLWGSGWIRPATVTKIINFNRLNFL